MDDLKSRLDKIYGRVTSNEFLSGESLSGEIPFYAFDYPPKKEVRVREHVGFLISQIAKKRPEIRIAHVNLLELAIDHLRERKLYDKALELQSAKGNDAAMGALKAPLDAGRIATVFVKKIKPEENDLVFVTGVGSSYPLLRTHSLLNNLHPKMGKTPLIFFYPGVYDQQSLKLFGKLKDKSYYRAFRLVD